MANISVIALITAASAKLLKPTQKSVLIKKTSQRAKCFFYISIRAACAGNLAANFCIAKHNLK